MTTKNVMGDYGEDGLAVLAFKVEALQFDLNRDLKYISMKDQLIRGRTLVLAAHHAELVDKTNLEPGHVNVIVIGGGIGGVSAALMACQLGLSVKLVEAANECFQLLTLGSDRLFSATLYDWPHIHSGSHEFPYVDALRDKTIAQALRNTAATLRFPASAATAQSLRKSFLQQLQQYESVYCDSLEVLRGHRLNKMSDVSTNTTSKVVAVDVHGPNGLVPLKGQIIVFALGFGLDKSHEQTRAAAEFFSYKNLHTDVAVAQASPGAGLVRITGAGDGGLQEALRFALDDDWHDLHACVSALESEMVASNKGAYWSRLCRRLQSAEDQASKSLMWGYTDERVFSELDSLYNQEVDALLNVASAEVWQWHSLVGRKGSFTVELVDASLFSMKTYGLNRWLIALLRRLSPKSGLVNVTRILPTQSTGSADVELTRMGFAAVSKPDQIGTADDRDLLRRLAFQGIPMNLDAVV